MLSRWYVSLIVYVFCFVVCDSMFCGSMFDSLCLFDVLVRDFVSCFVFRVLCMCFVYVFWFVVLPR